MADLGGEERSRPRYIRGRTSRPRGIRPPQLREGKTRQRAANRVVHRLRDPQTKVDHAAKAVCDDSVYRVDLYEPADLLASLERATERVRALGPGADQAATLNVLKGEDCLPSQWISRFTRERLNSARENATTP